MFQEIKNRDAWASIRGFVYQVDATIHKWLTLNDDEILELEKGEDIDVIVKGIKGEEKSRELEQIKYRENKLSLNQNDVIELIFNFYLHKKSNPSKKINFCFISNTGYSVERPAIFSDGSGAIGVWSELSKLDVSVDDWRVEKIKNHLADKITSLVNKLPSDDTRKSDWVSFKNFVNDNDTLVQLIKSFEWRLEAGDQHQFSEKIRGLLKSQIEITNKNIHSTYARLFLYVFKLLSKKGIKKLDKLILKEELKQSQISVSDEGLYEILNGVLEELGHRVIRLENDVAKNTENITTLLYKTRNFEELNAVFKYNQQYISVGLPPTLKKGSLRQSKVEELVGLYKDLEYISFQGINGTGKSQLAALVANKFESCFWLELRPYLDDIKKVEIFFESFLSIISGVPIQNNKGVWLKMVIEKIPSKTIIVLNDLPRLEQGSILANMLADFVNGISKSSIRLLSTTNYKWTNYFIDLIDGDNCYQYYDFDFTDEEIEEYLSLNGANSEILSFTSLIAAFSKRNPTLLSAIVKHFKSIDWGLNSKQLFSILLKQNFSESILKDKQLLIQNSIKDASAKELLYRLSLINWEISFNDIQLVSEVEIKISNVNEKLQMLEDVWIQENSKNNYIVSPLITSIGEKNLSNEVIQNVHLELANSILADKIITEINASRCITSFIKGKDFNQAGIVLLHVYQSALTYNQAKHLKSWGYLTFWKETPIPEEMDILLKAQIRMEQIRINKILGLEYLDILEILENHLEDSNLSVKDRFLIHLQCSVHQVLFDSKKLLKHFDFIISHPEELKQLSQTGLKLEDLSGLLWTPFDKFESFSELKTWLKLIEKYESQHKKDFFENKVATAAIAVLSRRVSSFDKPNKCLNKLANYFIKRGSEVLESIVLKEIILLKFNKSEDFNSVIKIASKKLSSYTDSKAKYHLNEFVGKLHYDKGLIKESLDWLQNAIDTDCYDEYGFVETLIYLAVVVSTLNPVLSITYLEKALIIAEDKEEIGELDYLKVLGELAIANWLNGNNKKSYNLFSKFIIQLFKHDIKENKKYWIQLFSWSSHALGYIGSDVGKDRLPETVADGSAYTKPYQGFLSFNTKDLSDLYDPSKEALVYALMAAFADGVGKLKKSYYWSFKAFDAARKSGKQQIFLMVSSVSSQYALINFKIEETLESYLLFSAVSSHSNTNTNTQERVKYLENIDLKSLIESKPSKLWDIAESTTITFAVIPLFIKLLLSFLSDKKNKFKMANDFQNGLNTNLKIASNPLLWKTVLQLTDDIIMDKLTEQELKTLANGYADDDENSNFQNICLLGIIYISETMIFATLMNVIPYVTTVLKSTHSLLRNILFPFIKNRCIASLKLEYVGTSSELLVLVEEISNTRFNGDKSIRLLLQKVYEEIDTELPTNRKEWLKGKD
ncbi:hypothetical protein [Cellulophaga sp. Ld12]|uniref:hypothetical protein n=1 Tax=Cellulophaga sp. Ld12 TaxID=3229535 RepID=UPI003863D238